MELILFTEPAMHYSMVCSAVSTDPFIFLLPQLFDMHVSKIILITRNVYCRPNVWGNAHGHYCKPKQVCIFVILWHKRQTRVTYNMFAMTAVAIPMLTFLCKKWYENVFVFIPISNIHFRSEPNVTLTVNTSKCVLSGSHVNSYICGQTNTKKYSNDMAIVSVCKQ